jgi:putative tRNA adenosine deaminase-associated protein
VAVSYFTAVIAAEGDKWRTRDVEIEDAASLEDLADTLSVVGFDDEPVLAVIEHEDEWFALVRIDGEEEPRVFVSDLAAASRGTFAEVLAAAADVDSPLLVADGGDDPDENEEEDDDTQLLEDTPGLSVVEDDVEVDLGDLDDEEPEAPPAWAGHADLLADYGVSAELMVEACEEHAGDPAAALAAVGEVAGFGELLDALR